MHAGGLRMLSRRKEARYEVHEPAVLTAAEGSGATTFAVTVLDVSRSGLRVSLPARLEVGAEVVVRRPSGLIRGQVRYCRSTGPGEYNAGIQVTDVPTERRRDRRYPVNQD